MGERIQNDGEYQRLKAAAEAFTNPTTATNRGNLHNWDVHIELLDNRIKQAKQLRWINRKK